MYYTICRATSYAGQLVNWCMEWLKSARASLYLRYQCSSKLDPLFQWGLRTLVSRSLPTITYYMFHCMSFSLDTLGSAQVIPDVLKLMIFPGERYDKWSIKRHCWYANILAWVNTICMKMMVTLQNTKMVLPSIQLSCSPWRSLISKWYCK